MVVIVCWRVMNEFESWWRVLWFLYRSGCIVGDGLVFGLWCYVVGVIFRLLEWESGVIGFGVIVVWGRRG